MLIVKNSVVTAMCFNGHWPPAVFKTRPPGSSFSGLINLLFPRCVFFFQSGFSSIVRSGRYVKSVNILIDDKCLVFTKCLPSAKRLPTTLSLAFAKFLVIDKYLIDMTEMSFSNNFGY